MLRRHPGGRLLDIGCGGGHVSYLASAFAESVTACDLSPEMLATVSRVAAERGLANIETRQGKAEALPFGDASFDAVASRYSAHHWQDFSLALREAARVLKPGGLAVFIDVVAPGMPLLDTHLQTIEMLRDTSHVRDYSQGEWLAGVEGAGLAAGETATYRLHLEFSSWVGRMATPAPFVTAIKELQKNASDVVTAYFDIREDGSFTTDTLVLVARKFFQVR